MSYFGYKIVYLHYILVGDDRNGKIFKRQTRTFLSAKTLNIYTQPVIGNKGCTYVGSEIRNRNMIFIKPGRIGKRSIKNIISKRTPADDDQINSKVKGCRRLVAVRLETVDYRLNI